MAGREYVSRFSLTVDPEEQRRRDAIAQGIVQNELQVATDAGDARSADYLQQELRNRFSGKTGVTPTFSEATPVEPAQSPQPSGRWEVVDAGWEKRSTTTKSTDRWEDVSSQFMYAGPQAAQPSPDNSFMGSAARGLKKTIPELKQAGAGVVAYLGDVLGSDGMREWGLDKYQKIEAETKPLQSENDSFSKVFLDGEGSKTAWLGNAVGYTLGQVGTALVSGGIGALGGKFLAKKAITEGVERAIATRLEQELAAGAARDVAEQAALKAGQEYTAGAIAQGVKTGAITGAFTHNVTQELGSIYNDAVEQAKKDGRSRLDGGDLFRIGASALVAAGVDTAAEAVNFGKVFKGGVGETIGARAAREIPAGMVREGATEAVQTGIEQYGAAKPFDGREIIDAAALGAVGGGMAGGAASLRKAPTASQVPIEQAADAPITAPVKPEELLALPSPSMPAGNGVMVQGKDGVRPQTFGEVTALEEQRRANDARAAEAAQLGLGEAEAIKQRGEQRQAANADEAYAALERERQDQAFQQEQAAQLPAPVANATQNVAQVTRPAPSAQDIEDFRREASAPSVLPSAFSGSKSQQYKARVEAAQQEGRRLAEMPGSRDQVSPSQDSFLGVNDNGEKIYRRDSDGYVYHLRDGKPRSGVGLLSGSGDPIELSANGQPFSTEKAAQLSIQSRRIPATVVPVQGGYGIQRASDVPNVPTPANNVGTGRSDSAPVTTGNNTAGGVNTVANASNGPAVQRGTEVGMSEGSAIADSGTNGGQAVESQSGNVAALEDSTEFTHNGLKVSLRKFRQGEGFAEKWVVQTPENAEREARGERQIGGDSVVDSREAAIAEASRLVSAKEREDARIAEIDRHDAEKKAQDDERKAANKGKTLTQIKAEKMLSSLIRSNGEVMTRKQWVEKKLADGATPSVTQENRVKPLSTKQNFRATNEQQRAHEQRMKEAGKKDVYWLGDTEVSKTEHDYARQLIDRPEAATEQLSATPQSGIESAAKALEKAASAIEKMAQTMTDRSNDVPFARANPTDAVEPPFSRADTPISNAVLKAVVPRIKGVYVKAFATPAEAGGYFGVRIPQDVRGVQLGREIALIEKNIPDQATAEFVLWHELLHVGIMATHPRYGKEYQRLISDLINRNPNLARESANWRANYGEETVANSIKNGLTREQAEQRMQMLSVEEALADLAGQNVQINGIKNFIAKVQQLLRAMGFENLANWMEGKTDAEALAVILQTRDALTQEGAQFITNGIDEAVGRRANEPVNSRAKNEGMATKDVVGNQSGAPADDITRSNAPNAFDTDERAADRAARVADVEEDYRLPNIGNAVPPDYVPRQASQKNVTIYRGVPDHVKNAAIRPGDWVSLDKKYAQQHGTGETGRSKVISMTVPADHVGWAGTDMNEWFYAPRSSNESPTPDGSGVAFSRALPDTAPLWRSVLSEAIGKAPFQQSPAPQWKAWLQSNAAKLGVKKDEIEWSGITDWLDLQQGKVSREQVQQYLDANGVKISETELGSGLSGAEIVKNGPQDYDVVDAGGNIIESGFMARQSAQEFIDSESKGDTKYSSYTLPGGENYRELLLTLPPKPTGNEAELSSLRAKALELEDRGNLSADENGELNEIRARIKSIKDADPKSYNSSHWDQPNILAHIRFNERTDADGKRVLFIEEIQSDWGQAAKKNGIALTEAERREVQRPATNQEEYTRQQELIRRGANGVPNAPFVGKTEAWVSLALKRMIRYAVDGGFDRVAMVNGEQSAERYDLSKQIDRVEYVKRSEKSWMVEAYKPGDRSPIWSPQSASPETLEANLGKEVAQKIIDGGKSGTLSGLDLKVGGEGMKKFYDAIVPQVANDVLKKLGGGKVGTVEINQKTGEDDSFEVVLPNGKVVATRPTLKQANATAAGFDGATVRSLSFGSPQPGFDITDKMREQAAQGMPLFSRKKQTEEDRRYFAAIESGDMETAQRIVDTAAVKAGYVSSEDYRMSHRAPNREDDRLDGIKSSGLVPDDYWTRPDWYQGSPEEWSAFGAVSDALRRNETRVASGKSGTAALTVYRAVPKSVKEDSFRNGDWVTPSEEYARREGQQINGGYRIIKLSANLSNLWWDGNSIAELGYDNGEEYAYKNTKNNRKLTQVVTKDDDGNIIPPSQRFNSRVSDARYSRTTPGDMLDPKASDAQAEYNSTEAVKNAGDTIKELTSKALGAARDKRSWGLAFLGRRQILDIYGNDVPALNKYNDILTRMEASQNDGAQEADAIVQNWRKLKPETARAMAELMHDATLTGVDPDVSNANETLRKRWINLPEDGKQLYRQARDTYAAHFEKVKAALEERVMRSGADEKSKKRMLAEMRDEFTERMGGVYFPLARFGDYMVVVKDKSGETKAVSFAESQNQANELRASLVREYPDATVGQVQKRKEFNPERDGVSAGFMKDVVALINQESDPNARETMLDSLNQLYLSSLPDLSWAKSGIHRKGTPGYSQDAMRAFARNMFHGGYYLAKLNYGDQLQGALMQMQSDIDNRIKDDPGYSNVVAQDVVTEMNKRHKEVMSPSNTPLANTLTGLGFLFHMGLSPASAAVNLSQTALVAYPMLGAKFGFGKAASALMKASGEAVKGKNDLLGQLTGQERAAFEQAVKDGVIDLTMAHDLAGVSQGRTGSYNEKTDRVFRVASRMFHEAEKFNRGTTFLAGFRLAKEAGQSNEAAFKTAADLTYAGHFDYASSNRARVMQSPTARVVLLFKQYGQNMIYTLARNTYKSFQGDKEAQKTLAGLLAMHGTFAGVLGLPLVTTLLAAASAIGGSDDEPWDAQVALRNYLADVFGPELGEVLAHGIFRAPGIKDVIGGDISGRVGLDSMLIRMPQETLEGKKYGEALMSTMLGPVAGVGLNILGGAQTASQGDLMRGLEEMMPKAIKDPLKALRYDKEGIVDKSRITLIDNTTVPEEVAQFLGFSPARGMESYEGKAAIKEQDTKLNQRRKELLNRFARAREDGEDMTDIRDMIQRWNRANPDRAITGETLIKSVQNRAKRQAEADNGVYLPKNKRSLTSLGDFASVE